MGNDGVGLWEKDSAHFKLEGSWFAPDSQWFMSCHAAETDPAWLWQHAWPERSSKTAVPPGRVTQKGPGGEAGLHLQEGTAHCVTVQQRQQQSVCLGGEIKWTNNWGCWHGGYPMLAPAWPQPAPEGDRASLRGLQAALEPHSKGEIILKSRSS